MLCDTGRKYIQLPSCIVFVLKTGCRISIDGVSPIVAARDRISWSIVSGVDTARPPLVVMRGAMFLPLK